MITISTALSEKNAVTATVDEVPVFPLGLDILVRGKFRNEKGETVTIENPETSQNTIVHYTIDQDFSSWFFVTPSSVDAMGEVTIPIPQMVELKSGESTEITVSLYKYMVDRCLAQGLFEVWFAYDTIESRPCAFRTVFMKRSVMPLLSLLQKSSNEEWVRRESLRWLKLVRPDFGYQIGGEEEENRSRIDEFREWWEANRDTAEMDALFVKLQSL